MGFTVSFPSLKLTRGESNGKKSANYGKILKELGNERYSTSETLDRSKSTDNIYHGYKSGKACMSAIDDVLEDYTVKVTGKDGVVRERKIRNNATVAYSMVLKPPADVVNEWDDETRKKFLSDSMKVLEEICPEIFGGGSELIKQGEYNEDMTETVKTGKHNLLMIAEHFDEAGWHAHCAGMPFTSDGRLSGAEVMNIKTYGKINTQYPERMRELGWDIDKLDTYDVERAKTDPEYKRQRVEQRRKKRHGSSVNTYIHRKEAEKAIKAMEETKTAREELISIYEEMQDVQEVAKEIEEEAKQTQQELQDAQQELAKAKTEETKIKKKIQDMAGNVYLGDDGKRYYGMQGMKQQIAEVTNKANADIKAMQDNARQEVKEYTAKHKKKAKDDAEKILSEANKEAEQARKAVEQERREAELLQEENKRQAEYVAMRRERITETESKYEQTVTNFNRTAEKFERSTSRISGMNTRRFVESVVNSIGFVIDKATKDGNHPGLKKAWETVTTFLLEDYAPERSNLYKVCGRATRQYEQDEQERSKQVTGMRKDLKEQGESLRLSKQEIDEITRGLTAYGEEEDTREYER